MKHVKLSNDKLNNNYPWQITDFHCIVAMLNGACHFSLMGPDNSTESMQHLSRTFRLVNESLSGVHAVSDATFAAVVAMTQYYQLRSEYEEGLIHLDGLEQMVNLCGGIGSLRRAHPALAQKLYRYEPNQIHYNAKIMLLKQVLELTFILPYTWVLPQDLALTSNQCTTSPIFWAMTWPDPTSMRRAHSLNARLIWRKQCPWS